MNYEDMIAYDAFTKQFRSSTKKLKEISCNKSITSTTYTTIATINPKLKGELIVDIVMEKTVQSQNAWVAIYLGNTLINEQQLTASESHLRITFPIEQAMTEYTLKVKNNRSSFSFTVTSIQLYGEIYDTGNILVSLVEA